MLTVLAVEVRKTFFFIFAILSAAGCASEHLPLNQWEYCPGCSSRPAGGEKWVPYSPGTSAGLEPGRSHWLRTMIPHNASLDSVLIDHALEIEHIELNGVTVFVTEPDNVWAHKKWALLSAPAGGELLIALRSHVRAGIFGSVRQGKHDELEQDVMFGDLPRVFFGFMLFAGAFASIAVSLMPGRRQPAAFPVALFAAAAGAWALGFSRYFSLALAGAPWIPAVFSHMGVVLPPLLLIILGRLLYPRRRRALAVASIPGFVLFALFLADTFAGREEFHDILLTIFFLITVPGLTATGVLLAMRAYSGDLHSRIIAGTAALVCVCGLVDLLVPPAVYHLYGPFTPYSVAVLGAGAGYVLRDLIFRLEEEALSAWNTARTKSEVLATMSHEIRAPISAVLGMAGLLKGTKLDAEQTEIVSIIANSSDTLLHTINDILDFSRLEAGEMPRESRTFHLREAVEEIFHLLEPKAVERRNDLQYIIEPGTATTVMGDQYRLRQILLNLVGNAVKFTENGLITVIIRGGIQQEEQITEISVRDTGIGIPPDKQRLLFQPFSQASIETARVYGGTGLGLAISRKLAELLGGQIKLKSAPGAGSEFTVILPLRPVASDVPVHFWGIGKHVIVISPSPQGRQILSQILSMYGFTCTPGAPEALQRVETWMNLARGAEAALVDARGSEREIRQVARQLGKLGSTIKTIALVPGHMSRETREIIDELFTHRITRPLQHLKLLELLSGESERTPREQTLQPSKSLRIAVADDDPISRQITERMLERAGFRVSVVEDGAELLALLEESMADLILLDAHMPRMDGPAAALEIRRKHGRQPLIALLSAGPPNGRVRGDAFDFVLSKPLKVEDISMITSAAARRP